MMEFGINLDDQNNTSEYTKQLNNESVNSDEMKASNEDSQKLERRRNQR